MSETACGRFAGLCGMPASTESVMSTALIRTNTANSTVENNNFAASHLEEQAHSLCLLCGFFAITTFPLLKIVPVILNNIRIFAEI